MNCTKCGSSNSLFHVVVDIPIIQKNNTLYLRNQLCEKCKECQELFLTEQQTQQIQRIIHELNEMGRIRLRKVKDNLPYIKAALDSNLPEAPQIKKLILQHNQTNKNKFDITNDVKYYIERLKAFDVYGQFSYGKLVHIWQIQGANSKTTLFAKLKKLWQ